MKQGQAYLYDPMSKGKQCREYYLDQLGIGYYFCLRSKGHSGQHRSGTGHHWDKQSMRTKVALKDARLKKEPIPRRG